jgi:hypothetical protein
MATSGIRKRVSRRTGRVSYQVWWRMEDGSQGARTVSSRDEARELLDEKRLDMRRGTWRGASEVGWRSTTGLTSGGPTGRLTPIAARIRSSWQKADSATTYARSSVTGPSRGSGRPMCVAGKRNLTVGSATTR